MAPTLRATGHTVHTPTLTGRGERVRLASARVDLDAHIEDIVNVLRYVELAASQAAPFTAPEAVAQLRMETV